MLDVKNLVCARNEKILFSRVAFNLGAGELLQIVGKNGIGKTTLLRTIAGLIRPVSGQIELNPSDLCYVGHKSGLHPDLTVLQNLQFLQTCMAYKNNNLQHTIDSALEYFAIQHKKFARFGDLSAGQCQRINLARLYLTPAKIWLLDEPLAHLDKKAGELLAALCIQNLIHGGIVLLATHANINVTPFTPVVLQLDNYG